ncbi:MAG: alanine racemase [bacterium]|nr:alanine racemase [bacterium]
MTTSAPSRAIVDLGAYSHNLDLVKEMLPAGCTTMPVVKANAYGHGAVRLAQRAVDHGATMFAVATIDEALELRANGVDGEILLLLTPHDDGLPLVVEHNLRVMVSEVAVAERLGELARRANKVVPIHCKIDTGMGRQGFDPDSAVADLLHITRVSHVDIEAVVTHLAVADESRNPFTTNQIKLFKQVLRQLEKEGVPYEMVHAANSAAVVNHPSACAFDMVRPGLITYGVWPTDTPPVPTPLRPVLRWEAKVIMVKYLPAGTSIGYGRTYTAKQRTRTAVVPVGYADGYRFTLSNRADVLIRGTRCPVRGRVSMDQIVVDVTHLPSVTVGDTATLIGADGSETITVAELAEKAGTIPYDILTGIGPRVPRVYVE